MTAFPDIIDIFQSWAPNNWDQDYAERYYSDYFYEKDCSLHDEVFVKREDGKVVGVIGYRLDRLETNDVYWLGWFFIHKAYTQRGYGNELLQFVINELKNKNLAASTKTIMVSRLDGPTPQLANKLVDKAIKAKTVGLKRSA